MPEKVRHIDEIAQSSDLNLKNTESNEGTNTALLLIDVQKAFDDPKWGKRNHLDAEDKIAFLLALWRKRKGHVIHVQHASEDPASLFYPERETFLFKEQACPVSGEKVVRKNVNSAFIGTDLEEYLRENRIDKLVIAGLTTPHCVSTTTRMAANLGFECCLVEDATVSFELESHTGKRYTAEEIQEITLVTLNEEFAAIVSSDNLK